MKHGDYFKSLEDAVVDSMRYYMPKSIEDGVEYAWWYYYDTKNGQYTYGHPTKGEKHSVNPDPPQTLGGRREIYGLGHSHPAPLGVHVEGFSAQDEEYFWHIRGRYPFCSMFVGTRNGNIWGWNSPNEQPYRLGRWRED
jgi:hypothetical protein